MAGRVATFANLPAGRDNGFNLIRVVAALAVIASHSVPLTLGEEHRPFLFDDIVPGRVAVLVFFAISGYFISQSWDRRTSARAYLVARALRILLGLLFVGATLYHWRNIVPFSGWLALGLLVTMILTRHTKLSELCMVLALAYGSLWLGFRGFKSMTAYNRFGDYSYGVYIHAFPVQQLAVTAGFDRPLPNALATILVVLQLAVLSWHLVEKPALNLKDRLADIFVREV